MVIKAVTIRHNGDIAIFCAFAHLHVCIFDETHLS